MSSRQIQHATVRTAREHWVRRASVCAWALLVASTMACSSDEPLYKKVSVEEIEAGMVPPGLAELGPHAVAPKSLRCYPSKTPRHCYYRALPLGGRAAPQEPPESPEAARPTFAPEIRAEVMVRITPGAEQASGFEQRPAQEGRFAKLAILSFEDQQEITALGLFDPDIKIFIPDSGHAGTFGSWGKLVAPLFIAMGAAVGVMIYFAVRAGSGERMGATTLPVTPEPLPPAPAPPVPAPAAPTTGFRPGAEAVMRKNNGEELVVTVIECAAGRCLCDVGDGRKVWVGTDRLMPRG